MRRVKVAVIGQSLHERSVGRPFGQRSEHSRRVDDQHRDSVAIAAGTHGSNDVSGRSTAGSRSRSPEHVADGGALGNPLEFSQRVVGQRNTGGGRART
jgi:hypothetical protein